MGKMRLVAVLLAMALLATTPLSGGSAGAGSAAEINRDVDAALSKLYATIPNARHLGAQAKAVLIFPGIVKAGFPAVTINALTGYGFSSRTALGKSMA